MASNAAADSGEDRSLAASTTDQRVFGKARGASLLESWLPMLTSYPIKLPIRCHLLRQGGDLNVVLRGSLFAPVADWFEQATLLPPCDRAPTRNAQLSRSH